jgi:site-specific DNA recombinase
MMPSTNGHGPQKRAILYTRVSGNEQREHGYSLSDQKRELKEWVAKEGSEVLEEVEDGAWSGGFLERPGLDRVRERVTAGGVDAVVVLFRDQIARGVYAQILSEEFAESGCMLIVLNAPVDDSPKGELHSGMLDLIAGWERKKIAERTRRGRAQKAREGKIVAGRAPNYGFTYSETHDGYVVDEEQMRVMKRVFSTPGASRG